MYKSKMIKTLFLSLALIQASLAATIVVNPGQSIQTAINSAKIGDLIQIKPGVYHEGVPGNLNALTVNKGGIEIVGLGSARNPVVLENSGRQQFGIWVSPPDSIGNSQADSEHPPCAASRKLVTGFSLKGLTIRGFDQHGVHLACVKGFNLSHNISDGNKIYGLFPIVSQNGVVADNEAKNSPFDAAIYVGQSKSVTVSGNSTHHSLIGLDLQNIRDCLVVNNRSFGNSVGMVIDSGPGLTRPASNNNQILFNTLINNNAPPSPLIQEAIPPSGIGIVVSGANGTTIRQNRIGNNNFSGILVSSHVCPDDPTCGDPNFNPTANSNHIIGNTLIKNGTAPNPDPVLNQFRADLSWDGTGMNNCWSENQYSFSAPPVLPACR
jgi:hypothetical protein